MVLKGTSNHYETVAERSMAPFIINSFATTVDLGGCCFGR
jgi:hypothetical protein